MLIPESFIAAISVLLILCLASFVNLCTYRLAQQQPLTGRSQCLFCKHPLAVYDLVPILSYLWLKGACRHCKAKIPKRIFVVELVVLVLTLLLEYIYRFYAPIDLLLLLLVIPPILGIMIVDFEHFMVPNLFVLWITVVGVFAVVMSDDPLDHIAGMALGMIIFSGIGLLYKVSSNNWGFGMGDLKLVGAMGLFLGYQDIIFTIVLAIFIGGIVGMLGLALKKLHRKSKLPFGSFLAIAFFIVSICRPVLSGFYFSR